MKRGFTSFHMAIIISSIKRKYPALLKKNTDKFLEWAKKYKVYCTTDSSRIQFPISFVQQTDIMIVPLYPIYKVGRQKAPDVLKYDNIEVKTTNELITKFENLTKNVLVNKVQCNPIYMQDNFIVGFSQDNFIVGFSSVELPRIIFFTLPLGLWNAEEIFKKIIKDYSPPTQEQMLKKIQNDIDNKRILKIREFTQQKNEIVAKIAQIKTSPNLKNEINILKKDKRIKDIFIQNDIFSFITTTIRIRIEGDGIITMGEYKIDINFQKCTITIKNLSKTIDSYAHPHVNQAGVPCLGNLKSEIEKSVNEYNILNSVFLLLNFLESYNDKSAYISLLRWS